MYLGQQYLNVIGVMQYIFVTLIFVAFQLGGMVLPNKFGGPFKEATSSSMFHARFSILNRYSFQKE